MPDPTSPSSPSKRRLKPTLAITMGDPSGVGPEIALKAVTDERALESARLVVIGDEELLRRTAREQKLRWPFAAVDRQMPAQVRSNKPVLISQDNCAGALVPGQLSAGAGTAAAEAIEHAVELATTKAVDGLVTGPIHKESLSLAGITDAGHTDFIARLSGTTRFGTLLWVEAFAAGLLSTHVSIKDALKRVRRGRIVDALLLFDDYWRRVAGRAPRIGVAALNPHGGEGSRLGTEEVREIRPAIEKVRERGLLATGPVAADGIFLQAKEGRFDLVLALYHDQAAVPIKLLSGRRAVIVTAGLPFVRTSVEHGPAMDIAGRGTASASSLVEAIVLAAAHVLAQGGGSAAEENGSLIEAPPPSSAKAATKS